MREPTELISNVTGLFAIAGLAALIAVMPREVPAGPGGPPGEIAIALEAAAEPTPEPPKPEEPPPAPAVPEPPQPVVETPPPPPPPELEPAPPDQPPEPPEQLIDEDGAPITAPPDLKQATEEVNTKFGACLAKRTFYPSTKEARRLKPHGVVHLKAFVDGDGKIVSIEITKSSGSPILDQAARSSVQKSGCGALGKSSILTGVIAY